MKMALTAEPSNAGLNARAAVVNRTRRIVRERAVAMQARKRTARNLVVPCIICSIVLVSIAVAVWSVADEGIAGWEDSLWKRITELGGDAGSTISILLVWFLPLSVISAAAVLLRRARTREESQEAAR